MKRIEINDLELLDIIKGLYRQIAQERDWLDLAITLNKMNGLERAALANMIEALKASCRYECSAILANVEHDVNGFKARFMGLPISECWRPRSAGYAQ